MYNLSPVSQIGSELHGGRKSLEVVRVIIAYSAQSWPAHAVRYDQEINQKLSLLYLHLLIVQSNLYMIISIKPI